MLYDFVLIIVPVKRTAVTRLSEQPVKLIFIHISHALIRPVIIVLVIIGAVVTAGELIILALRVC